MVFIPNKYCCVIFISLLLWKNCLPRFMNNEQGNVLYLFTCDIILTNGLIRSSYYYGYVILDCKKKVLF